MSFSCCIVLVWSILSESRNSPIFQSEMIFAVVVGRLFYLAKEVNFYFLLAKSFETIMNTSWFLQTFLHLLKWSFFLLWYGNIQIPLPITAIEEDKLEGDCSGCWVNVILCVVHLFGFQYSTSTHLLIFKIANNLTVSPKCYCIT